MSIHFSREAAVENFWTEIARAFALMLVLEGITPFLYPGGWRKLLQSLATSEDSAIRTAGLVTMLAGVLLLYFL